jgi:hypothetical protein
MAVVGIDPGPVGCASAIGSAGWRAVPDPMVNGEVAPIPVVGMRMR